MIRLLVDGSTYAGAESVSIERSYLDATPSFSVSYADRWYQGAEPWAILPGDTAEVYWNDHLLITGYVNVADWSIDSTSYVLSAAGRSLTQDLIDCAATHATGQWRKKTMLQIATDLCAPFNVQVDIGPTDSEKFELFRLEPGETVYSAIERMARIRGYLITSLADGSLLLVRADAGIGRRFSLDPSGAISRAITANDQDRFSEYRISSQTGGTKQFNKAQVAKQKFSIEDPGVDRYRPMVIVSDGPGHRKEIEAAARYERNVRAGRSLIVTYEFPGILDPQGQPWEPGSKVEISDPALRLNRELVIDRVSSGGSAADLKSTIELVRPETYSVLDFIPKDRNARI